MSQMPALSQYQWIEDFIWLICFICAAIAAALFLYCGNTISEDKKADGAIYSFT